MVPTTNNSTRDVVEGALAEAADALKGLRADATALHSIAAAADMLAEAFKSGNRAYACGNGGSMCDAMHFAEELSGRFRDDRPALPAQAISDPGHLSCVANDFGYDRVFARYVEAHGAANDVLLAISTSGNSQNVVSAAAEAKNKGLRVIALVGRIGSPLAKLADVTIATPGGQYADRVQELHIKVIHILIEAVERSLFNSNDG